MILNKQFFRNTITITLAIILYVYHSQTFVETSYKMEFLHLHREFFKVITPVTHSQTVSISYTEFHKVNNVTVRVTGTGSDLEIFDCLFFESSSAVDGGAIFFGGSKISTSKTYFKFCESSSKGSTFCIQSSTTSPSPTITSCTIFGSPKGGISSSVEVVSPSSVGSFKHLNTSETIVDSSVSTLMVIELDDLQFDHFNFVKCEGNLWGMFYFGSLNNHFFRNGNFIECDFSTAFIRAFNGASITIDHTTFMDNPSKILDNGGDSSLSTKIFVTNSFFDYDIVGMGDQANFTGNLFNQPNPIPNNISVNPDYNFDNFQANFPTQEAAVAPVTATSTPPPKNNDKLIISIVTPTVIIAVIAIIVIIIIFIIRFKKKKIKNEEDETELEDNEFNLDNEKDEDYYSYDYSSFSDYSNSKSERKASSGKSADSSESDYYNYSYSQTSKRILITNEKD